MPRYGLILLAFLVGSAVSAEAAGGPIMCTMDYRPVCGLKDGRWQTFSNGCMAGGCQGEAGQAGRVPRAAALTLSTSRAPRRRRRPRPS